ncbi:MAG: phage holin family protein [Ruminococcus sp.]|nr:phage holin family protein [Ruminococcus sp.]
MKEKSWRALIAVALGGLSAYMRVMFVPLVVLIGVMIVDYMSGMLKAWGNEELSSRVGLRGIVKKLSYLMLVCVAGVVDWLLWSGLRQVGISLDFGFCFGLIVTIWLIINELISILENLEALKVPMPKFLKNVVKHLKNAVEVKGDKAAESEEKHGQV